MRIEADHNRHILIVDDSDEVLDLMGALVAKAGYPFRLATSGPDALATVAETTPDLILLDIKMPGLDGYEVCRQLKENSTTQNIPVIFMSALNESADKVKGFKLGAVDYISKPFDNSEVLARIKTHIDLYQLQTRLEQTVAKRTKALTHEQALLRCVIDAIPDLISFEDRQGIFLGCNKAFENFCGQQEKTLVGQSAWRSLSRTAAQLLPQSNHMPQDGEGQYHRGWISRPEGDKVLLDTVRISFGESYYAPLGFVTISHDMTVQEKAQQEHLKLSRQLKQAQKLEAIGTLAGGIAHDFNNILSSVIGFAELAQDDAPTGSMQEDNLNEVLQAGLRAKELVSQILTFACRSDEIIKPVNISLIAKETTKLLKATLPATIQIHTDLQSDTLVLCDPTQIHQVFMNLCTNASHAMEGNGGFLTLKVANVHLNGAMAEKHHLTPGHYLQFLVSDTGTGIAPQHIEKIFEPYFTTKPQGEGTGLGLSVVHGIVASCNGAIEVDSKVGQGTVFTLYFPIAKQDKPANSTQPKNMPRGNENILVVDDETSIAKINSQVLQAYGYSVTTCTNSLAALELFRSDPYQFNLLLTDMTMPHMSGDQLATKIGALQPGIPTIICTGYTKKLSAQRAKKMGINAFIMKPFSRSTLLFTIRKVLDEQNGNTIHA